MEQTEQRSWFSRLGGYLLIPHELLHLAGFRLVGKRCRYQWGKAYVTPLDPMSLGQRLIGMLLPFVVFTGLFVICTVLAGLAYPQPQQGGSLFWFIFWLILMQVMALYAGTTLLDLRRVYLLLVNKPWHSWTPFDLFFWPVVDWTEVRQKISSQENSDEQS